MGAENKKGYQYGNPDCPVGTIFQSRAELHQAGVHGQMRQGIHGLKDSGAYAIVLSGDYEDDRDYGWQIIYTGEGGRDEKKRQIQDQSWSNDSNSSLEMSVINGLPVRVIRKHLKGSKWGPPTPGYRYDGLYKAIRVRNIIGEAGYKMCQVLLERLPGQEHLPWTTSEPDYTKVNRDGDGWVLAIAEADKVPSKPTQIQTSLRVDETRSAEPPQASPIQSDSTSTLPESMTQSQIARGKSKLPPISFHKNKN